MSGRGLLVVALVLATLAGCADPGKVVSVTAYHNAVQRDLRTAFDRHGIAAVRGPECRSPGAARIRPAQAFSTRCTAVTARGRPVVAFGRVTAAGTEHQQVSFRVLLAGTEVFRTEHLGQHR
ncbi:hypothetical protein GCM10027174_26700 [Salinifilum aidingensis]